MSGILGLLRSLMLSQAFHKSTAWLMIEVSWL
jgi:hypothetical protein